MLHSRITQATAILILFFLSNFSIPIAFSQEKHTIEHLKAVYVYKFIQYVQWPNEQAIKNFTVGFYGDDETYYNELMTIQDKSIKGFTLSIARITSLQNIQQQQLDALVIGKDKSNTLSNITQVLNRQATLIISDMTEDKKNTMLNFTMTADDTLMFELNRYNMLNANLKVSPDILVLGGSELDIAQVIKEMDDTLTKRLTQLQSQADKLGQLQGETQRREQQLKVQQQQMDQQQQKIAQQTQKIVQQGLELTVNQNKFFALRNDNIDLSQEVELSREKIALSTQNLNRLKDDILQKESSISNLAEQIEQRKSSLQTLYLHQAKQEKEIAQKRDEIAQQLTMISDQSTVISTQSNVLSVAVVVVFSVLMMFAVIYRTNRIKQKANQQLQENINALANANQQLKDTQGQLAESEKMAALGGLVAGVAHEINTPLGVSVTAASHLSERVNEFSNEYVQGKLKRSSLDRLLRDAKESSLILLRNLSRASELIRNFKQVAVDQSSEKKRKFELKSYLDELINSLKPKLKQDSHQIVIEANNSIGLHSYPGVIAQIMSNLILNSVKHGFKGKDHCLITIGLDVVDAQVIIDYQDNGKGLTDEQREKVFEPFYTTARSSGGSGLGMSISYNLVIGKLGGTINCIDSPNGAHFKITFPETN